MTNERLERLIAERKRISQEINEAKRELNESVGVKIVRYSTGRIILKVLSEDKGPGTKTFRTVAGGYDLEETLNGARLIANRLLELCDTPIELITINKN